MSILIKGMEMPKGCLSCFVKAGWCSAIRKRMEEASRSDRWVPENYRHDDCPLIEVPEDVQPVKHGRWIQLTQNVEPTALKCSLCGEISCCRGMYCPDCGAKMDGDDNG